MAPESSRSSLGGDGDGVRGTVRDTILSLLQSHLQVVHKFLIYCWTRARQFMGYSNLTTILCLDGGGMRGIIPATILVFLESELQKLDGEQVQIADYFDVISGTSTGALIGVMLSTPNEHGRPMFSARDILNFYLQEGPKIFRQPRQGCGFIVNLFKVLLGPKYDGGHLRRLMNERLRDKRLHDALTNLVIPTFDMKLDNMTVFSSFQLKEKPSLDALLFDICLGTSAAPTYLPPHYFETQRSEEEGGGVREFNLIDGGIGANNPTSMAIEEVKRSMNTENGSGGGGGELLVLSLGTGTHRGNAYGAKKAVKWGVLQWARPLINSLLQANSEAVDRNISSLGPQLGLPKHNYLRIQDDTLEGDICSVDIATEENLNNLAGVGYSLLEKPLSRVDSDSGMLTPIIDGDGRTTTSNRVALKKFAERLSQEKRLRDANNRRRKREEEEQQQQSSYNNLGQRLSELMHSIHSLFVITFDVINHVLPRPLN